MLPPSVMVLLERYIWQSLITDDYTVRTLHRNIAFCVFVMDHRGQEGERDLLFCNYIGGSQKVTFTMLIRYLICNSWLWQQQTERQCNAFFIVTICVTHFVSSLFIISTDRIRCSRSRFQSKIKSNPIHIAFCDGISIWLKSFPEFLI